MYGSGPPTSTTPCATPRRSWVSNSCAATAATRICAPTTATIRWPTRRVIRASSVWHSKSDPGANSRRPRPNSTMPAIACAPARGSSASNAKSSRSSCSTTRAAMPSNWSIVPRTADGDTSRRAMPASRVSPTSDYTRSRRARTRSFGPRCATRGSAIGSATRRCCGSIPCIIESPCSRPSAPVCSTSIIRWRASMTSCVRTISCASKTCGFASDRDAIPPRARCSCTSRDPME